MVTVVPLDQHTHMYQILLTFYSPRSEHLPIRAAMKNKPRNLSIPISLVHCPVDNIKSSLPLLIPINQPRRQRSNVCACADGEEYDE